jgi:hypothetical protein
MNMTTIGLPELLILFVIGLLLLPSIFFLRTLQKALNRCAPESRTMTPAHVWLMLIPLFNIVWQFIVVFRVASSLGNEFRRRKIPAEAEPGQSIGLASSVLLLTSFLPVIGLLTGIAGVVYWIVYWVKIANYSSRLTLATPVSSNSDANIATTAG